MDSNALPEEWTVTLSTVTPVYSGEVFLRRLVEEIERLRNRWQDENAPVCLAEAIFVDDGSIDRSSELLAQLEHDFDWLRVVTLSRNFGQHAATVAGICHSFTDWVVTLDEDLQHKPEMIEDLLRRVIANGADLAYAHPKESVHGGSWRDRSSRWTKKLIARMTGTPEIVNFNSFRLIRGSIARAAASASSSQTYLDIALTWFTRSTVSVTADLVDERFVESNKSGYQLSRLIRHARNLIVSSHVDVAAKGVIVGAVAVVVAICLGLYVTITRIFFPAAVALAGWASLVAITTFFGGVIIGILCLALEYISVMLMNQLGKPTFFTIDRNSDKVLRDWFSRRVL